MPNLPDKPDPSSWNRYFAVEANNRAWELAEQSSLTKDEVIDLLNAAHSAAIHWEAVGNELNIVRAEALLANAHAIAGHGDTSLRLAEKVVAYFGCHPTESWEHALVHAIHARAAHAAGQLEVFHAAYAAAETALEAVNDPGERQIVLATFSRVPAPS